MCVDISLSFHSAQCLECDTVGNEVGGGVYTANDWTTVELPLSVDNLCPREFYFVK